jgi:hypothetical protein
MKKEQNSNLKKKKKARNLIHDYFRFFGWFSLKPTAPWEVPDRGIPDYRGATCTVLQRGYNLFMFVKSQNSVAL